MAMKPQQRHFKDGSPEPRKYETVLEYCGRGGFFGDQDRCPDCPGHPKQITTDDWNHWNEHDSAKALYHHAWSENEKAKRERRRLNPNTRPPVTPEKRCHAISVATGTQCRRTKVSDDPAELCHQHRTMVERYGVDGLRSRAEAFTVLVESIVE